MFAIYLQLARVRDLLEKMEEDSDLKSLTRNERDILLAFHSIAEMDASHRALGSTDRVRSHPTVAHLSQPTFHRTLKRLVAQGYVQTDNDLPNGTYVLP